MDWQIHCVWTCFLCSTGQSGVKGTPLESVCLFSREHRCRGKPQNKCLIYGSLQLTVCIEPKSNLSLSLSGFIYIFQRCHCVYVQSLSTCACRRNFSVMDSVRSECDSSNLPLSCSISAVSESPCSSDRVRKSTREGGRTERKRKRAHDKGGWYHERKIMTLSYPFHLTLFCSFHLVCYRHYLVVLMLCQSGAHRKYSICECFKILQNICLNNIVHFSKGE